jgi:hypothetical protein
MTHIQMYRTRTWRRDKLSNFPEYFGALQQQCFAVKAPLAGFWSGDPVHAIIYLPDDHRSGFR